MTSDRYEPDWYERVAVSSPDPRSNLGHGQSGYLTHPSESLDPSLFMDGTTSLHPDVRVIILDLFRNWVAKNFHGEGWWHLWITGSGISYQWAAGRGNGDLDIMVGVDSVGFTDANFSFAGMSVAQQASEMNQMMHETLWPSTASTRLHGKLFEVTYYWNPGVVDDITVINPYAAYDLMSNRWIVHPPELPDNPGTLYPTEWFSVAEKDAEAAKDITLDYHRALTDMDASAPGTPGWHDAGSRLHVAMGKAGALFHDIHTGRRAAFSEQGEGYGDWHNFRYQRAKKSGALEAMHTITDVSDRAKEAGEVALYGFAIPSAEAALHRAVAANRSVPQ